MMRTSYSWFKSSAKPCLGKTFRKFIIMLYSGGGGGKVA